MGHVMRGVVVAAPPSAACCSCAMIPQEGPAPGNVRFTTVKAGEQVARHSLSDRLPA
jgi:hypothetical protein